MKRFERLSRLADLVLAAAVFFASAPLEGWRLAAETVSKTSPVEKITACGRFQGLTDASSDMEARTKCLLDKAIEVLDDEAAGRTDLSDWTGPLEAYHDQQRERLQRSQGGIDETTLAKADARLKNIREIIDRTRDLRKKTVVPEERSRITRQLAAAARTNDAQGRFDPEPFKKLKGEITLAKDQRLNELFDGSAERAKGKEQPGVLAAEGVDEAVPDTYPKPEQLTRLNDFNGDVPLQIAQERDARDAVGSRMLTAVAGEVANRFAVPEALARSPFYNDRTERRTQLLALARRALRESGAQYEGESLDYADGLLMRRFADAGFMGGSPWPTAAKDQEDFQRKATAFFQELGRRGLATVFEYFKQRMEYREAMAKAVYQQRGQIPNGMRFEPWELGQDPSRELVAFPTSTPVKALAFVSVSEGGKTYRGIRQDYANGTSRFEGFVGEIGQGEGLIVTKDAKTESRVQFAFGKDGKADPLQARMLTYEKKKLVSERLEDIAKGLVRVTEYEDGRIVRSHTADAKKGTSTVEDFKEGVRIHGGSDGAMLIVPLKAGDKPWTSQQGKRTSEGFRLDKITQKDGTVVDFPKPHIIRALKDGKAQYQLKLDGFASGGRAHADQLAREVLGVLAGKDKRFADESKYLRPLASALGDLGRFTQDAGLGAATLDNVGFDEKGNFSILFRRADGTAVHYSAAFDGGAFDSKKRTQMGLAVRKPTVLDAKMQPVGQAEPFLWRVYLAGGERNDYPGPKEETIEQRRTVLGVTVWRSPDKKVVTHIVQHKTWNGRNWVKVGGDDVIAHAERELAGTGWGAATGKFIDDIPVVGTTLKYSGKVAGSGWEGLNYLTTKGMTYVTSGDTREAYELAANGHKVKTLANWTDDIDPTAGLSDFNKSVLNGKAVMDRQKAFSEMGFNAQTVGSRTMLEMNIAPATRDELKGAAVYFGSPAQQAFDMAEQSNSLGAKIGFYAMGVVMEAGDKAGRMLLDPTFWATLGLGAGIKVGTEALAMGRGVGGLSIGLTQGLVRTAQVANAGITAVFVAPMATGAMDSSFAAYDAFNKGDTTGVIKHTADALTNFGMLYVAGKGGAQSLRDLFRPLPQGPGVNTRIDTKSAHPHAAEHGPKVETQAVTEARANAPAEVRTTGADMSSVQAANKSLARPAEMPRTLSETSAAQSVSKLSSGGQTSASNAGVPQGAPGSTSFFGVKGNPGQKVAAPDAGAGTARTANTAKPTTGGEFVQAPKTPVVDAAPKTGGTTASGVKTVAPEVKASVPQTKAPAQVKAEVRAPVEPVKAQTQARTEVRANTNAPNTVSPRVETASYSAPIETANLQARAPSSPRTTSKGVLETAPKATQKSANTARMSDLMGEAPAKQAASTKPAQRTAGQPKESANLWDGTRSQGKIDPGAAKSSANPALKPEAVVKAKAPEPGRKAVVQEAPPQVRSDAAPKRTTPAETKRTAPIETTQPSASASKSLLTRLKERFLGEKKPPVDEFYQNRLLEKQARSSVNELKAKESRLQAKLEAEKAAQGPKSKEVKAVEKELKRVRSELGKAQTTYSRAKDSRVKAQDLAVRKLGPAEVRRLYRERFKNSAADLAKLREETARTQAKAAAESPWKKWTKRAAVLGTIGAVFGYKMMPDKQDEARPPVHPGDGGEVIDRIPLDEGEREPDDRKGLVGDDDEKEVERRFDEGDDGAGRPTGDSPGDQNDAAGTGSQQAQPQTAQKPNWDGQKGMTYPVDPPSGSVPDDDKGKDKGKGLI